MTQELAFSNIRELAKRTNVMAGDAEWFLFGSAKKCISEAQDIDLLIVCDTPEIADTIRRIVNLDTLERPLHLSILTKSEEDEVHFVKRQNCIRIL